MRAAPQGFLLWIITCAAGYRKHHLSIFMVSHSTALVVVTSLLVPHLSPVGNGEHTYISLVNTGSYWYQCHSLSHHTYTASYSLVSDLVESQHSSLEILQTLGFGTIEQRYSLLPHSQHLSLAKYSFCWSRGSIIVYERAHFTCWQICTIMIPTPTHNKTCNHTVKR